MQTVIGIFGDKIAAQSAIEELEELGFNPKDVSIVVKNAVSEKEIAGVKGGSAAEGAVSGAATGGVLGGITGLLIGIGALAIPGVGAFLVGGPIATVFGLTGAAAMTVSGAATGALAGGVAGGLIGLGIPEEDAKAIQAEIKKGAVLVAVPASSLINEKKIKNVYKSYSAEQVRTIERV